MPDSTVKEMRSPFDEIPETDATREAFEDPQAGDCFQEVYSFWMYVVHIDGEHVATVEASPPCTLPGDGKLRHFQTREQFQDAYGYHSPAMRGRYWMMLADRGRDVRGWYDLLLPDFPMSLPAQPGPEPVQPAQDLALTALLGDFLAQRFTADGLGFMLPADRVERAGLLLDALASGGFVVAEREGAGIDA